MYMKGFFSLQTDNWLVQVHKIFICHPVGFCSLCLLKCSQWSQWNSTSHMYLHCLNHSIMIWWWKILSIATNKLMKNELDVCNIKKHIPVVMLSKKKPICNGFSANKRKLGFCRRDSSTSFFRRSSSILVDKMLSWVIPLLKDTLFVYRLGTFSRKYIWKYPTGGSGRSRTNEICSKPHNHTLTGHWLGCACPFYTLFQGLLTCIVYYWELT